MVECKPDPIYPFFFSFSGLEKRPNRNSYALRKGIDELEHQSAARKLHATLYTGIGKYLGKTSGTNDLEVRDRAINVNGNIKH